MQFTKTRFFFTKTRLPTMWNENYMPWQNWWFRRDSSLAVARSNSMTLPFLVQCFVHWAIKQNGKLVEQDRQIYSSVDWESVSRAVLNEDVKRPQSVLPVALLKCKKSRNFRDESNSEAELRKNLSWWCQPGLLFDLARTRFRFLPNYLFYQQILLNVWICWGVKLVF